MATRNGTGFRNSVPIGPTTPCAIPGTGLVTQIFGLISGLHVHRLNRAYRPLNKGTKCHQRPRLPSLAPPMTASATLRRRKVLAETPLPWPSKLDFPKSPSRFNIGCFNEALDAIARRKPISYRLHGQFFRFRFSIHLKKL